MKKILHLLLFVSAFSYGQFNVTDLDGNIIPNNAEFVFSSYGDAAAKLKFKTVNTSNANLDIRVRSLSILNTNGVGFQLCYGGLCYDNISAGGTYPDFQNIIAPGQDNGNADYFVNNVPGDGVNDLIYSFRVFAFDMNGTPIGDVVNITYKYSPNLSNNSFESLSNLGIDLKNTVSQNVFEMTTTVKANVQVFSLAGQKLRSNSVEVGSSSLDLSGLQSAYYILNFTTSEGKSASIKVLKQ